MSDELLELRKIEKILTIAYAAELEKFIGKYASTVERKKIWVLIDGNRFPKDIVQIIGNIQVRAIERFLDDLEELS